MTDDELCGAELRNGKICHRKAGWGVSEGQSNPDGRCKDHLEEKNQSLKKRFVDFLENNITTLKKAGQEIGRSESTVWKWRQKDKEFDRRVRSAKESQRDLRAERVKDAVFKRIMDGEAAASTTIFWLKNNAGWKSNPETVVNVQQKQQSVSEGSEVSDRVVEKLERLKSSQSVDKKED